MKPLMLILSVCFVISLQGCSQVSEPFKVVWGSSTKALEDSRSEAIRQTFACSFDECFDAVLSFARSNKNSKTNSLSTIDYENSSNLPAPVNPNSDTTATPVVDSGIFDVFIQDRIKGLIVVIGIEGNVDTTEVGIFFSRRADKSMQIEITSLSDSAKRKMAAAIFSRLVEYFKKTGQ